MERMRCQSVELNLTHFLSLRESSTSLNTLDRELSPALPMMIPAVLRRIPQVGAQFGFAMLWTMLFSYPLMAGIQEISASIGRVTGMGIAANIRRHYPVWVLYPIVILIRMKVDWFLAAVMDQAHARQMTVARGQNGRKN
jgi:hypothetical protein